MQRTNAFTIEFLSVMHTYLFDEITKIHSRMDALQFTRERSLAFPRLATFLLYQHSHSLGTRVQPLSAGWGI